MGGGGGGAGGVETSPAQSSVVEVDWTSRSPLMRKTGISRACRWRKRRSVLLGAAKARPSAARTRARKWVWPEGVCARVAFYIES